MTPRARRIVEALIPPALRVLEGEGREWLTTAEAARLLKVRPATVLRWTRAGKLRAAGRTPGGHYRYDPADVEGLFRLPEVVSDDLARAIVRGTK